MPLLVTNQIYPEEAIKLVDQEHGQGLSSARIFSILQIPDKRILLSLEPRCATFDDIGNNMLYGSMTMLILGNSDSSMMHAILLGRMFGDADSSDIQDIESIAYGRAGKDPHESESESEYESDSENEPDIKLRNQLVLIDLQACASKRERGHFIFNIKDYLDSHNWTNLYVLCEKCERC